MNKPKTPESTAGLIDREETMRRLADHLKALTVTIGERNMFSPDKLRAAAGYIESVQRQSGLEVELEHFPCNDFTATNVVAFSNPSGSAPTRRYILGAHYDCVLGTVGADDNASSVAVQLEAARQLHILRRSAIPVAVKFVSFALEEYPAYATRMGSRVHAKGMKASKEETDGMICLEMVGYACDSPGCQRYPFPLSLMNYPKRGDYIAIVGNFGSRKLVRELFTSFGKNPALPAIQLMAPLNGWVMPPVRFSDHAPFWNERFPAVMVTDSAFFRNPNYHLPADTMETLDYDFMARLVESLLIFFLST